MNLSEQLTAFLRKSLGMNHVPEDATDSELMDAVESLTVQNSESNDDEGREVILSLDLSGIIQRLDELSATVSKLTTNLDDANQSTAELVEQVESSLRGEISKAIEPLTEQNEALANELNTFKNRASGGHSVAPQSSAIQSQQAEGESLEVDERGHIRIRLK